MEKVQGTGEIDNSCVEWKKSGVRGDQWDWTGRWAYKAEMKILFSQSLEQEVMEATKRI